DRGGKLIMYHGWADSLIPATLAIKQWDRMHEQMGKQKVDSFARLFMVPGMDHCAGGTGTSTFELMTALSNWVEHGIAPDGTNAQNTPIAARAANPNTGLEARTRPLCPYPQVATYTGNGDINDATN